MTLRSLLALALLTHLALFAEGQSPETVEKPNPLRGQEPSSQASEAAQQPTMTFRQWRALYEAQQHVLREEYYRSIGHNPARPTWNALPYYRPGYTIPAQRMTVPVGRTIYYRPYLVAPGY
jgi:hypothetical protein